MTRTAKRYVVRRARNDEVYAGEWCVEDTVRGEYLAAFGCKVYAKDRAKFLSDALNEGRLA